VTTDSKARELPHKRRLGVAEPIRASQLQARPVEWLWPGRVPQGGLTVLAGEPGLGKSLLSIWLASGLSRGEIGGSPGASLFLTAEDSREHTVLPRLVAAGARCERVVFPPPEKDGLERSISLPDDVRYLRQLVAKAAVRLVVFDPFVAYLPGKVNSWQDQSLRGALAPLAALAQEQQTAVLLVAHLNKGQSADPLRRLGGSIGLAAAARSVLLLSRDPDDPEGATGPMRVLAQAKSNLGLLEPSLAYRIKSASLANDVTTASLETAGASRFSAAELLALNETEARSKLSEAEALLRAELEDGPRPVTELRAAALELGISITTLDRAKKKLGVQSVKLDLDRWGWVLSEDDATSDEVAAA
jgi:putative DNA primase/helicase